MSADFVYLASGSPRRRELLLQIGVPFRVVAAAVDETRVAGRGACGLCRAAGGRQSRCRLGKAAAAPTGMPVLAADTAVVLDGDILGKPADREDAACMLQRLSGRTHEVLTAVALRTDAGRPVAHQPQRSHLSAHRRRRGARLLGNRRTARQGRRLCHPGAGRDIRRRSAAAAIPA